jgi:hypothetical protein
VSAAKQAWRVPVKAAAGGCLVSCLGGFDAGLGNNLVTVLRRLTISAGSVGTLVP